MKNFNRVMVKVSEVVTAVGFVLMLSIDESSKAWFLSILACIAVMLLGVAGMTAFGDPNKFFRHVEAAKAVIAAFIYKRFHRSIKSAELAYKLKKQTKSYKSLYKAALESYDLYVIEKDAFEAAHR